MSLLSALGGIASVLAPAIFPGVGGVIGGAIGNAISNTGGVPALPPLPGPGWGGGAGASGTWDPFDDDDVGPPRELAGPVRKKSRRMNYCNSRALTRALRRIEGYSKVNKRVEKAVRKACPTPRRSYSRRPARRCD